MVALASLFDPGTKRHLKARGILPGWHCLEVGGGGGTIAAWLAHRVGPRGRVVATDIDTRFLDALAIPNLEVRRHNIENDPLPEAAFDLAHVRLVLVHLQRQERALQRITAALKPGGWLVLEEFDSVSITPDPKINSGEVLLNTQVALSRLMTDRGLDRRLGRVLFQRLNANKLTDVGAEARLFVVQRGSPGVDLLRANYQQLRDAMIGAGYITAREFAEDMARLEAPGFAAPSPMMWTAWGRRTASLDNRI